MDAINQPLLDVRNLSVAFHQPSGISHCHPAIACHAIPLPGPGLERWQYVAVETRPLAGNSLLHHVPLQPCAQHLRRLALAANPYRKMPAAREHPDVSVQPRQKLNIDAVPLSWNVVTQSGHRIESSQLRADVA